MIFKLLLADNLKLHKMTDNKVEITTNEVKLDETGVDKRDEFYYRVANPIENKEITLPECFYEKSVWKCGEHTWTHSGIPVVKNDEITREVKQVDFMRLVTPQERNEYFDMEGSKRHVIRVAQAVYHRLCHYFKNHPDSGVLDLFDRVENSINEYEIGKGTGLPGERPTEVVVRDLIVSGKPVNDVIDLIVPDGVPEKLKKYFKLHVNASLTSIHYDPRGNKFFVPTKQGYRAFLQVLEELEN